MTQYIYYLVVELLACRKKCTSNEYMCEKCVCKLICWKSHNAVSKGPACGDTALLEVLLCCALVSFLIMYPIYKGWTVIDRCWGWRDKVYSQVHLWQSFIQDDATKGKGAQGRKLKGILYYDGTKFVSWTEWKGSSPYQFVRQAQLSTEIFCYMLLLCVSTSILNPRSLPFIHTHQHFKW
jgi:hypothetical protein